jgi:hypothetical protein
MISMPNLAAPPVALAPLLPDAEEASSLVEVVAAGR